MGLGILLIGLFLALLLLRVPVAAALGASAVCVIAAGGLGLQVVSFNFQAGIAKFPLLAIPFFILAGAVMDRAGIAERIVRLLLALMGGWRAGAAITTVLAGMFWGAVSGSGPATVAAAPTWAVPTLLMWAGADRLVSPAGSQAFAQAAPPAVVQSHCFENAFHELFNETPEYATPVFDTLREWLLARFAVRY